MKSNKNKLLVKSTAKFVEEKMRGEATGHDWWHVYRVWRMARRLAKNYKETDMLVLELGALLHDIEDWKFSGSVEASGNVAEQWLKSKCDSATIEKVKKAISEVTFKGAGVDTRPTTLEGMIIQDADRLDAIGALGIARAFSYGGAKGREIYNPLLKPIFHKNFKQYKNSKGHTINHFYEKLFLLKDRMNTKAAKDLATKRYKIMKKYLGEFFKEWSGKA